MVDKVDTWWFVEDRLVNGRWEYWGRPYKRTVTNYQEFDGDDWGINPAGASSVIIEPVNEWVRLKPQMVGYPVLGWHPRYPLPLVKDEIIDFRLWFRIRKSKQRKDQFKLYGIDPEGY